MKNTASAVRITIWSCPSPSLKARSSLLPDSTDLAAPSELLDIQSASLAFTAPESTQNSLCGAHNLGTARSCGVCCGARIDVVFCVSGGGGGSSSRA